MTTCISRKALVAALATFPIFSSAASAQEAGETFDDYIGTVQLGESRRGVQTETATPTTELSQEELDARQASTLAELLDSVPGVTFGQRRDPARICHQYPGARFASWHLWRGWQGLRRH